MEMQSSILERKQEGTEDLIRCYRSGRTVYQELFAKNMLFGLEWSANSYCTKLDRPDDCSWANELPITRFSPFDIQVDGQSLFKFWEALDYIEKEENGIIKSEWKFKNTLRKIELGLCTELDASGFIIRYLKIRNSGKKTVLLSKCDVLCINLFHNLNSMYSGKKAMMKPLSFSVGYCLQNDWGCEGDFQWQDFKPGQQISISGNYSEPRFRPPYFILKDKIHGPYFVGCLSASNGWKFDFQVTAKDDLLIRMGCDGPAPLHIIEPNETFISPKAHFAPVSGDLDHAVQSLHDHMRKSVFSTPRENRFGLIETLLPPMPGRQFREKETLDLIDKYAEIGGELFFLDAIWFFPNNDDWIHNVGNWQVSTERYPNGLKPIRDYAHEKGMLFGLWMEPERISCQSPLFEGSKHLLTTSLIGDHHENINLADPNSATWMEDQIDRLIGELQLDFFRLDYNTVPTKDGFTKQGELYINNQLKAKENLYALLGRLRAKYPDVIFENCASGGGRCDPAILRFFDHTWITDWRNAPKTFSIFNGMTMFLPPERTEFLCGTTQDNNVTGSFDFHWRLALIGQPTIGIEDWYNLNQNPYCIERMRHFTSIYKNIVRPFRLNSKLFHHTPVIDRPDVNGWGVLELASKQADQAIAALFRLSDPAHNEYCFCFKGLNPGLQYQVTFDNTGQTCIIDGYHLCHKGLSVKLDCPLTSELIIAKQLET